MREVPNQPEFSDEAAQLRRDELVGELRDIFRENPGATEITCDETENTFSATVRGVQNSLLPPTLRTIEVKSDWTPGPGETYRYSVGIQSTRIGQGQDYDGYLIRSTDKLDEEDFQDAGRLLAHLHKLKPLVPYSDGDSVDDAIHEPVALDSPDPELDFSRILCDETNITPNCPDPTEHRHDKPRDDPRDFPDDPPDDSDGPLLV